MAVDTLPLRWATPESWARLAAADLPTFLADHAVCEQQAALTALSLTSHYPEDEELVERMTSLAIEEVSHLRRVCNLLRKRGWPAAKRRSNPYVQGLRERMCTPQENELKLDRLLISALIEARSCERFTLLLEATGGDPELQSLLTDLGPAERRHWEMFHRLASREAAPTRFAQRWEEWLEIEGKLMASRGKAPTVHG
ncbi:hypothetical protein ABI59_02540 [Acidobacteria bacterium Mor1]|nr:hypothetical protein ABI59_02540 [Acidobacteria bacterium Mor1]